MKLWTNTTRLSDASAQKSAAPMVFDRPSPMAPPISAPSRSVTSADRSRLSSTTTINPSSTPAARLMSRDAWKGRVSDAAHATAATKQRRVTRCQGIQGAPGYDASIIPLSPFSSLGPPGLRQPWFDLQGILVVELLQDRVGQPHP